MHRFDYYRKVAFYAGVPSMWVDDAAQDIAIRLWLAGDPPYWRLVAKRGAIEAARRYGPRTRHGIYREIEPISDVHWTAYDEHAITERILDLEAAWVGLTKRQRVGLLKRARGDKPTDSERMGAVEGRRRLRQLCA